MGESFTNFLTSKCNYKHWLCFYNLFIQFQYYKILKRNILGQNKVAVVRGFTPLGEK